ncbi:hypothetical protein CVIRNUC_005383 [Coccomyxa viridis]|uniref:Calcium-transporting ATPase n=1 Tax=Coccomyxa viridis TaxID=1274662 RepID=A0AAV1I798_9CHLO|nr:hypothetical protein CVIRNUC_005383 [Coccomyxa viridis]
MAPSKRGKGKKEPIEPEEFPSDTYSILPQDLSRLSEHKDAEKVEALGGAEGLAKALNVSLEDGISTEATGDLSVQRRQELYGANRFAPVPAQSFWAILLDALSDKVLIVLMVAATISTVIGAALPSERAQSGWTEGVAIWVAVIIVSLVASGNDYQKERQFKKINSQKDSIEVPAVRSGKQIVLKNTDVLVGDVLLLNTGDKVIADGLVIESFGLVIDEASLTGESDPMHKGPKDPWCRSGTQVTEGSGRMLVVAVGAESEWGRTMALVATEAQPTPLQDALSVLATAIGKIGLTVGVVCFVVLFVRWLVQNKGFNKDEPNKILDFFIFGVTIIVVAVPEGLPLAVTISLAYSMKQMMKDNNFVRVLAACETMGGATAICSDKTGTLTENRMTVVAGWFAGQFYPQPPALDEMPKELQSAIEINSSMNSKAFLIEHDANAVEFMGNRTECALLMLLRGWGLRYEAVRTEHKAHIFQVYNFSSERKMASVLLRHGDGLRLYNKGAAEIVLRRCVSVMDDAGSAVPLSDEMRAKLEETVTTMASSGLRTLCLTLRDMDEGMAAGNAEFWENPPDEQLTLCCIVGIKDPVRKEVPDAVATCQRAGITVRMVTGDNVHTAKHIARECGILTEGGRAIEGPVFRSMPEEDLIPMLPKLQVLARSSPQDKYTLVQLLKKCGEIVAVTGDGTNDAPALKESDVGLAMGIAGTEVAKEAADIVILDDNFSSIVKSVLWGRSVFGNIRKFLQFQLTVNLVALVLAFIAAITSGETPLNVLQLLWVNLIMDALGALALATEPPTPHLLEEKPHGRDEALISPAMWKHIFCQAFYQLFWLFLIVYGATKYIAPYRLPDYCVAFSNIQAQGISLPSTLPGGANSSLFTPLAPSPPGYWPEQARCNANPCINACCTVGPDGFCLDNLLSQGGHYQPDEAPLCQVTEGTVADPVSCSHTSAKSMPGNFCKADPGNAKSCGRYNEFAQLDTQGLKQHEVDSNDDLTRSNSVVFNAFIFMQLFNQINARKINDEMNVFSGIIHSHLFIYIWIAEAGLQVIIMCVPQIGQFFKVRPQSWQEWLFALAVGMGSLLVAIATKLLSKALACYSRMLLRTRPGRASKARIDHSAAHLRQTKWSPTHRVPHRAQSRPELRSPHLARLRELGAPHVTIGSLRRKQPKRSARRHSQTPLSPTYSLERSRTLLRQAPSKRGSAPARVSSGPTGMYTEHLAWARTLTKQASRGPGEGNKGETASVPILAYSD